MRELSPAEARGVLLRATGLDQMDTPPGLPGAAEVLNRLGCVQLDPLDRIGTNADLVLHARVDGLRRGDWARPLARGAFEHFAKERCLLPGRLFPCYQARAHQTPWWHLEGRLSRLPEGVIAAVLAEVRARGPLASTDLSDHGRVDPMDWNGWKGTAKAASMALEVLWTRCEVVTAGRTARGVRIYDVPERALPEWHAAPVEDPAEILLLERVRGAGLLSTATGPHWSMLSDLRGSAKVAALVASGALVEVTVTGSRRTYLARPEVLALPDRGLDDRLRILGPLDPVLWDRKLIAQIFDFDYIWEVYKPADKRVWGYYVTPVLYQGRLVGRIEARRATADGRTEITIEKRWGELPSGPFDEAVDRLRAFQTAELA